VPEFLPRPDWRRLEGKGEEIGLQVVGKKVACQVGDRVRLLTGAGGQTQVSLVEGRAAGIEIGPGAVRKSMGSA